MKIALTHLPFWPVQIPPLGMAYISAVLKKSGHQVFLSDDNLDIWKNFQYTGDDFWDEGKIDQTRNFSFYKEKLLPLIKPFLLSFVKKILGKDIQAIGFSVNSLNLYSSLFVAGILKEADPALKVFFGGPEVFHGNKLIEDKIASGIIDAALIGEAEESIIELVEAWENAESIDSIVGLVGPRDLVEKTKPLKRPSINFAELPLPDFSEYDLESYKTKKFPIMMSRGCVASCTFCTEFVIWKSYRIRTAESVFDEMRAHNERYGVTDFYFCDSLINGNHAMLEDLMALINSGGLQCQWVAFARADRRLTKTLLKEMKSAGCKELFFGFESGSNKILDLMNKKNTVEEGYRIIEDCFEVGIKVHGLFIIGFPGEEENDFYLTQKFIYDNRHFFGKISIGSTLQIAPLAPMSQRPGQFDVLLNPDGSAYFDEKGQWYSKDRSLNPIKRAKRLQNMASFLDSLIIDWDPLPPQYKKSVALRSVSLFSFYLRNIFYSFRKLKLKK
ncbi:MAG: B12-binding domain-containing radical SAM protein [Halobacteriovoraceae bacterium]|jgi:anaerobic magnesium-protoporphyrin IX monomethyl ester cyclase|nr:B12-binding domain-containing radical SAM protein [Halobacteriovoraceae bacterium]MBT5093985.1 B12-binding domain-containing radical SAM protein [Halobacteriovoraceae bacterium]